MTLEERIKQISSEHNVIIRKEETHQWNPSDRHLGTVSRRTFVSSRWYRVYTPDFTPRFRVRVGYKKADMNSESLMLDFDSAIDRLEARIKKESK